MASLDVITDERGFSSISGVPRAAVNHDKKKFRKNSNRRLSVRYQHLPDHEGEEGEHGKEVGDSCD